MASKQYTHDNPYITPYFRIYLGGKPLSDFEHNLVEEVTYEDTSTGSDLVSITIHDPDYVIIGDKRIVKSTKCKVEGGWTNQYSTWIDGYVSAVDVDFPEEGYPTIVIHVTDKSYIMNKLERKKVYKNMTYKAIAGQVAKRYGLKLVADSGKGDEKQESVTQSYETDIQFLSGIASEIGYLVYVKGNELHFKNKDNFIKQKPKFTLWYRRFPFDILSFRPRIIQADQLDELEEEDIDDKDKKKTKATSKKNPSGSSGGGGGGGGKSSGSGSSGGSSGSGSGGFGSGGGGSSGNKTGGGSSGGNMKYNPYTGKWEKVK